MESNDFILGSLEQAVKGLSESVKDLRGDIDGLRRDLNEINLFRAKVIGASMVVSVLSSAMFTFVMALVKSR